MSQSMAAPLRCVIYLRVSTEEQAERDFTEEGLSLPAQREACLQHVRDQGCTVVDEYLDRDSASKRAASRPHPVQRQCSSASSSRATSTPSSSIRSTALPAIRPTTSPSGRCCGRRASRSWSSARAESREEFDRLLALPC
jgi:Resolvase, N terminal domain